MKHRLLALTLSVFIAITFSYAAGAHADRRSDAGVAVRGQYIVVFKDSVSDPAAAEQDIVSRANGQRLLSFRYALHGFSARLSDTAVAAIRLDPRVAFVSEDKVVSIEARVDPARRRTSPPPPAPTPSPTPAPLPAQVVPTGVARISTISLTNTGAGVQVAVIDTGIDLSHPDLKANIAGGNNCTSSNTSDYADQNGHGTHVAGTIAALNNNQGVVGVAPGAKLWAVRVLDKSGSGTWSSVICGLDFVASHGPANGGPISVANMSLGGSGASDNNCGNSNNDPLHQAVCRVRNAGVTIVVAAGNNGTDTSGFVPAAYDDAVRAARTRTHSERCRRSVPAPGARRSWPPATVP